MNQTRLIASVTMICLLMLSGCEKEKLTKDLNVNENWSFSGTFETWGLEDNTSGTITLTIAKGHYECSTNLPYSRREGTLETSGLTLTFINELFFPVPALYGPGYALDGECQYEFDGEHLKIQRKLHTDYESGVDYVLTLSY